MIGLVTSQVVVLLDCQSHCLVQVLKNDLCLAQQSVGRTLVHVEAVLIKVLHNTLHGHGVDIAQLGDASDEGTVVVGALQRSKRNLTLHDGSVLGINMYVVYLLDEAHGHEDIAYYVTGINQAGLHLIETGIGRIDVLLLDLHLIVFLALGAIVSLFPLFRLRNSLFVIGVWDRFVGSGDRQCLFL